MPRLPDYKVENFKGLVTRIEDETLQKGSAAKALNWMSFGDHIELRRGQFLMGTEVAGSGRVTGLFKAIKADGTEVLFYTHARKIKYYDDSTEDWVEAGTNTIASDADGEDMAIDSYESIAGNMVYISSPNSSIYKIPVANPGSVVDQNSTSFRGKIKIEDNALYLWDRKDANGGFDSTGLFRGNLDQDELSDFTEVTSESVGTGDGSETNFTDTLNEITGVRTAIYVRVTDGTETFVDDRNGNLVGNLGGTGTVNYATGAIDVTFNTAPSNLQAITADYYYEDATSGGILDFSKSATRVATEAFFLRQDGSGRTQNIGTIAGTKYCFHELKTWSLSLSADDSDATNLIYRNKVGIPYWRAMVETGEGIYYVDERYQNDPKIRLLEPNKISAEIEPRSISDRLNLAGYRFDRSHMWEWGDFIMASCRTADSTINNRILLYNRVWDVFDLVDYRASVLADYNGLLIGGDDGSSNVFELFSGFDDEGVEIPNYYHTEKTDLGIEGTKTVNRFTIAGLIGVDQSFEVDASFDNGEFVNLFTIAGNASYVDSGAGVTIGNAMVGSQEVGGGSDGTSAYPYRREVRITTSKFENIQLRFRALGIGYVSISEYNFKDIRFKGMRLPAQYS